MYVLSLSLLEPFRVCRADCTVPRSLLAMIADSQGQSFFGHVPTVMDVSIGSGRAIAPVCERVRGVIVVES